MLKLDPKKHPKLIKVLNKIGLICKYVSIACFIGLFIMFVIACGWSCSRSQGSAVVASAEGETVAAESDDIDLSQYPSANLFNLSRELGTLSGGGANSIRQFNTNEYYVGLHNGNYYYPQFIASYSVNLSGVNLVLAPSRNYYGIGFPFIRSTDVYSFSCLSSSDTSSVTVAFYTVEGEYLTQSSPINQNFTINFAYHENAYYFVIIFSSSAHGSSVAFSNIMLNAGSTAYPYQPNLNDIYNQGYDIGYDVGFDAGEESGTGFQNGYDQGYTEGLAQSRYGFFAGAKISSLSYFDGSDDVLLPEADIPALKFLEGGVDFTPVYSYFNDFTSYFGALNIELTFSDYIPISLFTLRAVPGSGSSIAATLSKQWRLKGLDAAGNAWTISGTFVDENNGYWSFKVNEDDSDVRFQVKTIVFPSMGYADLRGLTFLDASVSATSSDQLLEVTYNNGYNAGFDVGFDNGYQEGFDIAANGGSFGWLISSVQAILNVNFFGNFGIGTLIYVGLGCALVVMTLKFFAGG